MDLPNYTTTTYCVKRIPKSGRETILARKLDSIEEAAEVALRLTKLQDELGGDDEFCAEAE